MAEILVCPTGAVDAAAKRELKKAGVVVVETDSPERVQFIRSSEIVSTNDMLWAALAALNKRFQYSSDGEKHRALFTELIFGIHETARKKRYKEPELVDAVDPVGEKVTE